VNNSLRFRSSASAYLSRTPATTTNRRTWTVSCWIKRGRLATGTEQTIFGSNNGTTFTELNYLASSDTLKVNLAAGSATYQFTTTAVFRDPAAWYHIVVAVDTTQATSTDRMKIYVNGIQQDGTNQVPVQNYDTQWNVAQAAFIGSRTASTWFNDCYLTEFHSIDGQALTPSSFGAINSYGVWQPTAYGGSYGTNGFYLPFTNTTSTTTLGFDFSPNGNNWTPSAGISLTAGATYDSMTDVPTLTSATAANYAVMNPLNLPRGGTMSNGNLLWTAPSAEGQAVATLYVSSGKFYWEMVSNTAGGFGFGISIDTANINTINVVAGQYVYYNNGNKYIGATPSAYGATYTNGDIIGIALDLDAGTLVFYKNNVSQGTATTGLSGTFTALIYDGSGAATPTFNANFGQQPFTYTPPSGFVALNTFNM
jgi:hypothetical protein